MQINLTYQTPQGSQRIAIMEGIDSRIENEDMAAALVAIVVHQQDQLTELRGAVANLGDAVQNLMQVLGEPTLIGDAPVGDGIEYAVADDLESPTLDDDAPEEQTEMQFQSARHMTPQDHVQRQMPPAATPPRGNVGAVDPYAHMERQRPEPMPVGREMTREEFDTRTPRPAPMPDPSDWAMRADREGIN